MTARAGVIGWPVAHSLSPRIHRYWLAEYGIDGRYEAVVVPPIWLADAVDRFRAGHWAGFNVTVPHKEAILPLLDSISPLARGIGAVNTVVALEGGGFEGRNSDAPGFLASIRSTGHFRIHHPAVVLGAGGAARAIVAALSAAGFMEIRIVNRDRQRADALAAPYGATVLDWDERAEALSGAGLLVNATSLGMVGEPELDIVLERLPFAAVVTDIVYRPLETRLLATARARGHVVADGLGMLLHQAVEGFSAWFGVTPEVTPKLRGHVLAAIERGG